MSDEWVDEDSLLESFLINFLKFLDFMLLLFLDDVSQGVIALLVHVVSLDLFNPLLDLFSISRGR